MLRRCPDEPLASPSTALAFITQADLAAALLRDLGAVDRAVANGEWKAATVLAGSLIEAILLWALQQRSGDIDASTAGAALLKDAQKQNKSLATATDALNYGGLHHYLSIAEEIALGLRPDTITGAKTAKNFRNLIHPGRAERLGEQCDHGTAFATVGALRLVIRDLTPQSSP